MKRINYHELIFILLFCSTVISCNKRFENEIGYANKSFSNENIKKEDSSKNNKNMYGGNIFIANNNGLVIKENLLNEIYNKSDIDHGKTASQLNSYVLNLLSKRKNREKIPFSDENLYVYPF